MSGEILCDSQETKVIFAKLLLDYKIKWSTPLNVRPPPLSINGMFAVNQEQRVLIRRGSLE